VDILLLRGWPSYLLYGSEERAVKNDDEEAVRSAMGIQNQNGECGVFLLTAVTLGLQSPMIKTFAHKGLEGFFLDGNKKGFSLSIPGG